MDTLLEIKTNEQAMRVPVTVFTLAGELDGSNYTQFQQEVLQAIAAGTRYVLLDLGQLKYISSAGLRALYVVAKTLSEKGGAAGVSDMSAGAFKSPFLKLLNPTSAVHAALDVMGFNMSMEIYNSLPDALASF